MVKTTTYTNEAGTASNKKNQTVKTITVTQLHRPQKGFSATSLKMSESSTEKQLILVKQMGMEE